MRAPSIFLALVVSVAVTACTRTSHPNASSSTSAVSTAPSPSTSGAPAPVGLWSVRVGQDVSGVVVAGKRLYVAAGSHLLALRTATGAEIWQRGAPHTGGPSAPVVAGSSVLVEDDRTVEAFDTRTGREIWRRPRLGYAIKKGVDLAQEFRAANVVAAAGGLVFVLDLRVGVEALDAKTGHLVWRERLSGSSSQGVTVGRSVVYVTSGIDLGPPSGFLDRTAVQAFDQKTGALLWTKPIGPDLAAPIAVGSGHVYVSDDVGAYRLYALDEATGSLAYQVGAPGYFWWTPAVAGDRLFVASGEHAVSSLAAGSGKTLWRVHPPGARSAGTPVPVGGSVLISGGGALYALAQNSGHVLWSIRSSGGFGDPVVDGGVLYVSRFAGGRVDAFALSRQGVAGATGG